MFRKDKWRAVDEAMADKLLDLDPTDEEYGTAIRNYKTLREAKGDRQRNKLDPNVVSNVVGVLACCALAVYGENVFDIVIHSKVWPKILLPKIL